MGNSTSSRPLESATRKDNQGTFRLAGLLGGRGYTVSASAEGYGMAQSKLFTLKAGEKKTLPPLTLRKADAVLQGQVTDLSGKPVMGVLVRVSGKTSTTDTQGRYRVENLPHGTGAYVQVSHADYEEDYQPNINPDSGPVNFVLRPKFNPAKVLAQPGRPAPELVCAYWLNSEPLTWEKLRGKVVLLAFVAADVGPCERLLPQLKEWQEHYAGQGFTVVQIQDRSLAPAELRAWVQKKGLSYPVAMVQSGLDEGWAGQTFSAYGVVAVPALFLIDRAGNLHSIPSLARLREQIEELLAASPQEKN
jgi:thiol-disulfide isomerase/thioredoxin